MKKLCQNQLGSDHGQLRLQSHAAPKGGSGGKWGNMPGAGAKAREMQCTKTTARGNLNKDAKQYQICQPHKIGNLTWYKEDKQEGCLKRMG